MELGNDLLRAQHALQMAIDTLGIVKTIFLNNRHYWIQVTQSARQQGSASDTQLVLKVKGTGQILSATRAGTIDREAKTFFRKKKTIEGRGVFLEKN